MSNLTVSVGQPHPLGATMGPRGCNFAVHCPSADGIELCLFDKDTEEQQTVIPMAAKSGKIWHCCLDNVQAGQLYGYRVIGENHI
jgi:glycogen operon protein